MALGFLLQERNSVGDTAGSCGGNGGSEWGRWGPSRSLSTKSDNEDGRQGKLETAPALKLLTLIKYLAL